MSFPIDDFSMVLHRAGHPTVTYVMQDEDTTGAGSIADPYYYGYTTRTGEWMITARVTGTSGRVRFAFGRSGYAAAWTARASKTYNTLDQVAGADVES